MITLWGSRSEDQGCQQKSGAVADGESVEPDGDRTELPEPGEASFDHVAVAVDLLVEGGWSATVGVASFGWPLVAAFGDRGGDAPASLQPADLPAGVGPVTQDVARCNSRPARPWPWNADAVENLNERGGVMGIAGREHDRQRQDPAVDGEVDLRGQSAPGPAECLARRLAARIFQLVPICHPFAGAGSMLVSPVYCGVDRNGPLHPAHHVVANLHVLQQLRPRPVPASQRANRS